MIKIGRTYTEIEDLKGKFSEYVHELLIQMI